MGGTGVRHSRDHYGAPAVLLVRAQRDMRSLNHVLCVYACTCGVCVCCVCVCVCVSLVQPDSGHYYGFVYFRQAKDADIKRGYFQKVRMM